MSKRKTPILRFKGFHNDWEQRKLGDIAKRIVRKNKNLKSTLVLTISAQYGLVDQKKFFNKNIAGKNIAKYYLIEKGEFAYNKSYSKGHPLGVIKRLDYYDVGILSTLYIIFKPENINSNFLSAYYDTKCWYKEVTKYAAEGARNHGLLNIPTQDFFKTELIITTNNKEQQRIGNIIKIVNKILDLQERKYEELKLLKKALMQNMFANKSLYPKLRFKGFTDDWKQRKLGEVAITFSGGTPAVSDKKYYNGSIPFIKSGELGNKKTEQKITKLGLENSSAKMIKKGTLLYALYGATSGECAISSIDGAINQAILAILPQEDKIIFLLQWLNKNKEKILKKYLQGGQGNLSAAIIKKLEIPHTNNKEESQVSKIFKLIDSLLVLQQQKIEKLQQFKKFLLQNMFI